MESFHNQHTAFRAWMNENARASSIIVASIKIRAQLLARHPRVTILDVLSAVRTEEIQLCKAGLLPTPSILVVRTSSSTLPGPTSSDVPTAETSFGRNRPHCTYCNKARHSAYYCNKNKRDTIARRGGHPPKSSGSSFSTSSTTAGSGTSDTQEILTLLCRMSVSASPGAAGCPTVTSGFERSSHTQSGISPWILDSGASFHMTFDSTCLQSVSPLTTPFISSDC
ncbi:hypothetical protein QQ045_001756 [Rhodiola kirilowii]